MNATNSAPRPPDAPPGSRSPERLTLYAQPGITVTTDLFIIGTRTFLVRELTHLQTTRGAQHPLTVRAVAVTGGMLGGVAVLLGFAGGLQRLTAGAYLSLGAATLIPLLIALAGHRWRPPPYELWGRYQGAELLLFSSDEERQFGQVTRALVRAREANRLGAWHEPVASRDPWRTTR